ncbi:hypothetical protein RRF57_001732 [Xylaria bambusicola]|uniref:UBC core domain-containing protein n=1 Tax=Xylaria bambusicola TaxID=326684 RepID=A0AAN7Z6E5_9PEZI
MLASVLSSGGMVRQADNGILTQSVHENRIYSVKMHCGPQYPDSPPTIQFISQINLPCVNPRNGVVDPKQLPCLANWKRENTMETILIELRRYGTCANDRKERWESFG